MSNAALVVSTKATQNVRCRDGVCTTTQADGVMNASDLVAMLESGDVKLVAGQTAKDIDVDASIGWTASNTLTLRAYGSIAIANPISVTGPGGVDIVTNSGGAGGDLLFAGKGHLTFWDLSSKLTVNGEHYRLVAGIAGLAAAVQKNRAGNYALAADYDASPDGTYTGAPVVTTVEGKIEGLGNTVSHLTIHDTSTTLNTETAVFASNAGTIRDLRISAISASGGYEGYLAGLVGFNSGLIRNVSVAGKISGGRRTDMIGGVAAYNNGNWNTNTAFIENSAFVGKITAHGYAGGIAGDNNYGVITGTSAAGSVEGSIAGGVVGQNWGGSITWSHANSSVTGGGYLGGVAGISTGPMSDCYATGTITNTSNFGGSNGGLVGENSGNIDTAFATGSVSGVGANGGLAGRSHNGTVTNVYATGAVTHGSSIGGLVGESTSSISKGYSLGAVTLGTDYVGGAIGYGGAPGDVYWDLDTSQISNPTRGCGNTPSCHGVTGLTDDQMKAALPSGFNTSVWAQDPAVNGGYPYLIALPPPAQSPPRRIGARE